MSSRFAFGLFFFVALSLLLGACGEESPSAPPAADPATLGWTVLDPSGLNEGQQAQQQRAFQAKDALFASLSGKLVSKMQESGPAAAVSYCKTAAPEIHAQAGSSHALKIGRTSFKLRNPENVAPDWAQGFVNEKRAEPVVLAHEDGRLASLLPIRMMKLCTRCHGGEGQLDADAIEEVRRLYPDDKAIDFAEGDLRGWFWIEVPKP